MVRTREGITRAVSDPISRSSDQVEGQVKVIILQVAEGLKSTNEGRAKLYAAMDDLRGGVLSLQSDVKTMDARLKEFEPIVSEMSRSPERGAGVLIFLSVIAAGLAALITALWEKVPHAIGLK